MNDDNQPTLEGMSLEAPPGDEQQISAHPPPAASAPEPSSTEPKKSKSRVARKFPAMTFEDALTVGLAIQKFASGQKVRRIRLFELLQKSPESSASRQLVITSGQYGLTKGTYTAEYLELTVEGASATDESVLLSRRVKARFDLCISKIEPFRFLYDRYKGNKMPARDVLADNLNETGIPKEFHDECVDTFVVNAKFLGLLRTVVGTERLLPIEQILEELPEESRGRPEPDPPNAANQTGDTQQPDQRRKVAPGEDFDNMCFYVTPIGDPGSPERHHADFMLEYIVKPALAEFSLEVIRADQMSQPGMIGRQVVEHILKCRLVIADLSFHNPNVFYELCLRHTTRLPTVQIKRDADRLPFDLNQQRTISINTADVYALYPKLQTHVSEVATQVRSALQDLESADNPISLYYPKAKLTWE